MDSAWIAAGAAVAAAVLGPPVTVYVAIRQSRETARTTHRQIMASTVSVSRQAWIDRLRESIAETQAVASSLGFHGGSSYNRADDEQKFRELLRLRARIALLINPGELDHAELLSLVDRLVSSAYDTSADARKGYAMIQTSITATAQRILKREWERVKAGEGGGLLPAVR